MAKGANVRYEKAARLLHVLLSRRRRTEGVVCLAFATSLVGAGCFDEPQHLIERTDDEELDEPQADGAKPEEQWPAASPSGAQPSVDDDSDGNEPEDPNKEATDAAGEPEPEPEPEPGPGEPEPVEPEPVEPEPVEPEPEPGEPEPVEPEPVEPEPQPSSRAYIDLLGSYTRQRRDGVEEHVHYRPQWVVREGSWFDGELRLFVERVEDDQQWFILRHPHGRYERHQWSDRFLDDHGVLAYCVIEGTNMGVLSNSPLSGVPASAQSPQQLDTCDGDGWLLLHQDDGEQQ